MSLGILTLATKEDYHKAIGLALSVRISNPGVPTAVACAPSLQSLVVPYFDYVVEEDASIHGFMHKLHLDRYSPFEETFFFDSDVLVFRPLRDVLGQWSTQSYTACGNYVSGGASPFGLDRTKVLKFIGHEKLVHIDGAGHAYFRKPQAYAVFDLAREVAADYHSYAGDARFADEDVMDIVMTKLGLVPMPHDGFWSRYISAKRWSVDMDVAQGKCTYLSADNGLRQQPFMMHFAANEVPFVHMKQMRLLFRKFGVSTRGLMSSAMQDLYLREIRWRIAGKIRPILNRIWQH
jgi:hypothetical protein